MRRRTRNNSGLALVLSLITTALLAIICATIWHSSTLALILDREILASISNTTKLLSGYQSSSKTDEQLSSRYLGQSVRNKAETLRKTFVISRLNGQSVPLMTRLSLTSSAFRCETRGELCQLSALEINKPLFIDGDLRIKRAFFTTARHLSRLAVRGNLIVEQLRISATAEKDLQLIIGQNIDIRSLEVSSNWAGALQITSMTGTVQIAGNRLKEMASCHSSTQLRINSAFGIGLNSPPRTEFLKIGCFADRSSERLLLGSSLFLN